MDSALPVHGFVLAGGKSARMGRDKARLPFRGQPMVGIAVAKLRSFCREVAIVGNRDDLAEYASVVPERRLDVGPGAGLEAGLIACAEPWAMFMPVDVPLVPAALLRRWAESVLDRAADGCAASFLLAGGEEQPAFCLLQRDCLPPLSCALEDGERRLLNLIGAIEQETAKEKRWLWVCKVGDLAGDLLDMQFPHVQEANWFRNVNTPDELLDAESGQDLSDKPIPGESRFDG